MAAEAEGPLPPPSAARLPLVLVTAAFGLVLAVWALLTPMYQAPDELPHVDSSVRLALGGEWVPPGDALFSAAVLATSEEQATTSASDRSTFGEFLAAHPGEAAKVDQMTQHPPTYYLLAAAALDAIGFEDLRWDLSVLALRLLDAVLLLPLPWLVHATVLRVTRSRRSALVAAVALLAVPQLAHIGASVNNDGLTVLLASVLTWATVRVLTGAHRLRDVLLVGALLGVLLLSKGTGLPAVPFVAVALGVAGRGVLPASRRLLHVAVALSLALLVGGWWWLRNLVLYGDVQPSGLAPVRPTIEWPAGTGPDVGLYVDTAWNGITTSFWGQFGLLEHALSPVVTDVLSVLALVLVAGWAFRAPRGATVPLAVLPVVTVVLLVANTWRVYDRTGQVYGVQGRYLFVAIVALLVLAAVAARRAAPTPSARLGVGRVVVVGSVLLAGYGLLVAHRGFSETPPTWVGPVGLAELARLTPLGPVPLAVLAALAAVTATAMVGVVLRSAGGPRALPEDRRGG